MTRILNALQSSHDSVAERGVVAVSADDVVHKLFLFLGRASDAQLEEMTGEVVESGLAEAFRRTDLIIIASDLMRAAGRFAADSSDFLPSISERVRGYFYFLDSPNFDRRVLAYPLGIRLADQIADSTTRFWDDLLGAVAPSTSPRMIMNWVWTVGFRNDTRQAVELLQEIFRRMADQTEPDEFQEVIVEFIEATRDHNHLAAILQAALRNSSL